VRRTRLALASRRTLHKRALMISLVMATHNRAHTLPRALRSVLAQSVADWELVIVDGASTDATRTVIATFADPRIRYVREGSNEGMAAARNQGFDRARGEWIGVLDSDDELRPHALATLMKVSTRLGPRLDAISCNCVDAKTGRLTGHGLRRDRFLTVPLLLERARGEHWGIFRRRILAGRRFDPNICGLEGHLWYRVHDGALWYYVHRGLRIHHREGADRNTRRRGIDYALYRQLFEHDPDLLRLVARWSTSAFMRLASIAAIEFLRAGDAAHVEKAASALGEGGARKRPQFLRVLMHVRQ
jgi:glycosyltransferase involved in cell wall biosynthesis